MVRLVWPHFAHGHAGQFAEFHFNLPAVIGCGYVTPPRTEGSGGPNSNPPNQTPDGGKAKE